jgi:hypothetical protein
VLFPFFFFKIEDTLTMLLLGAMYAALLGFCFFSYGIFLAMYAASCIESMQLCLSRRCQTRSGFVSLEAI